MEMSLDFVRLTSSDSVRDGLSDMLTAAIGEHAYSLACVEVPIALLVVEAAKRAEDRDEWFPRGKWATIQAMQEAIEQELGNLFRPDGVTTADGGKKNGL
jgi:hypothetical protein